MLQQNFNSSERTSDKNIQDRSLACHAWSRKHSCHAVFIILFFIPESPRWLIVRKNESKAIQVLSKIYTQPESVSFQLNETKQMLQNETNSDWKMLFQPGIFRAVLIGCAIAMLGQFMGVNAVLYYGPSIFETSGLSSGDSLFYQSLIGIVNMGTTILALLIIDKVGRKKLVYVGVSA